MNEIEKEIKLKIDSPRKILQKIIGSGFCLSKRRHFEDNFLFDFDNKRLLSNGCILRLRIVKDKSILTYKEPSSIFSMTKVRKEIETDVADPSAIFKILENLGLKVIFRYQKYRRIYKKKGLTLSVDETPVGNFIELEGSEEEIITEAKNLGFSPSDFIKDSYMEIFLREKSGDMVFK
jgi:adenylate cyclase class 2